MWRILWKLIPGFLIGFIVGLATGASLVFALTWGLIDDVILAFLAADLTIFETIALNVLVDETEKLIATAYDYEEDTQRERDARAHQLQRENPHQIYLFGDFSAPDALALGGSAYVVAQSTLPETVFEVAVGLLEIV